ncbi:MAG: YihY/virulence factor BrkB family protein [Acidimicrobiales bacterium]
MTNPVPVVMRRLDRWQQRHGGAAFVFGVVKKYGDDRAGALAALITYYGFLSIFPLLLVLVTLVSVLGGGSASIASHIQHSALAQFPLVGQDLSRNIHGLSARSPVALVVGLLGLVWGSLGSTQAAQYAMAQVWSVPMVERPGFLPRLGRSAALLGILAVFLTASTFLAGVATFSGAPSGALRAGSFVLSVAVDAGMFVAAFRVLTPAHVRTKDLLPGAVAGGIAWAVLQGVGTYLVGHELRHASQLYGFFGTVLGLLWWMYLTAQIVLYASEVNVVRARRLWPRSLVQPPLTSADRQVLNSYALEQQRRPEQRVSAGFERGGPPATD